MKMDNLLRQWRQWIRPLCVLFCLLMTFVALPLMIVEFHKHHTHAVYQLWFIGGLFVLMALPISIWGILQHLINYTQPQLQRLIIRFEICFIFLTHWLLLPLTEQLF